MKADDSSSQLPPELIEELRQTGIRLDRNGRFWHQGNEVTHAGFRRALLRWLDLREDGRPILRLDEKRYAYVDVEDALLLVTSLRWQGDEAIVRLNDESEEVLDPTTLCRSPSDIMYCRVRGSRLPARITTPAYYVLAERVEEDNEGFVLSVAGTNYSIASC